MKPAKTVIRMLRSIVFTCCYDKALSPEEKEQFYDEICEGLDWLEGSIEDSMRPEEQREDIVVTGFGQQ